MGLTSVESTLTGVMDVRGALGVDDEPRNGFERIGVSFRVTGNVPAEKRREVVERARKCSAVYGMVTNGAPVARRGGDRLSGVVPVELTAHADAGARLVAIAEELAGLGVRRHTTWSWRRAASPAVTYRRLARVRAR